MFPKEIGLLYEEPTNPFFIKSNKLLVIQINDSCIPFISHNTYIFFFLSIFDVGLVGEKKFFLQTWDPQV